MHEYGAAEFECKRQAMLSREGKRGTVVHTLGEMLDYVGYVLSKVRAILFRSRDSRARCLDILDTLGEGSLELGQRELVHGTEMLQ